MMTMALTQLKIPYLTKLTNKTIARKPPSTLEALAAQGNKNAYEVITVPYYDYDNAYSKSEDQQTNATSDLKQATDEITALFPEGKLYTYTANGNSGKKYKNSIHILSSWMWICQLWICASQSRTRRSCRLQTRRQTTTIPPSRV